MKGQTVNSTTDIAARRIALSQVWHWILSMEKRERPQVETQPIPSEQVRGDVLLPKTGCHHDELANHEQD